jgi:hypothetical protein
MEMTLDGGVPPVGGQVGMAEWPGHQEAMPVQANVCPKRGIAWSRSSISHIGHRGSYHGESFVRKHLANVFCA